MFAFDLMLYLWETSVCRLLKLGKHFWGRLLISLVSNTDVLWYKQGS